MRRRAMLVLTAGLLAGVLAAAPARAAGGLAGNGLVTGGCAGSRIAIAAFNQTQNAWLFDVTVACANGASPQHVYVAGDWDASRGGPVTGFGNGSLMVGAVACGSNGSVPLKVSMAGAPLQEGSVAVTRVC